MGLSDWLSIIAIVLSFVTLGLTAWLQARMSASQTDDNIMNAVNSTLGLLEKVKNLNARERELFVQLLKEWDYFTPPKFIRERRGPKPSEATIRALNKYFDDLSKQGSPDGPDHKAA